MGASIKIQDTNLNITKFACSQCQQKFTNQDKENDNWDLWWDTSGEPVVSDIGGWWRLSAWVRDITHKDCPEAKEEVDHA